MTKNGNNLQNEYNYHTLAHNQILLYIHEAGQTKLAYG